MRVKEFVTESAAQELARQLPDLPKFDYDTIDHLMMQLSKKNDITGKQLHDQFVARYGSTPDAWVKKQDIAEGHGRYYCSTDKKWKTRQGPKQTRTVKEQTQLNELYDQDSAYPLDWQDNYGPEEMSARARDRRGNYIDIKFIPVADNIVDVEFSKNDNYDLTNQGDANAVFATVLEAFRQYLAGHKPKILIFSAKGGNRYSLYMRMIARFAEQVGYRQFDVTKLSPETQQQLEFQGSNLIVLRRTAESINERGRKRSRAKTAYGGYFFPGYGYYGGSVDAGEGGGDGGGGGESQSGMAENFADGKNPGRKGLAKRSGVNTKASVSSLRKTAKNSSGEKQRMAHWLANMKAGRAKAKKNK